MDAISFSVAGFEAALDESKVQRTRMRKPDAIVTCKQFNCPDVTGFISRYISQDAYGAMHSGNGLLVNSCDPSSVCKPILNHGVVEQQWPPDACKQSPTNTGNLYMVYFRANWLLVDRG